jgi:hypothetical protein
MIAKWKHVAKANANALDIILKVISMAESTGSDEGSK